MALDFSNADTNLSSPFNGAAGGSLSEELRDTLGLQQPGQDHPYEHYETLVIQQCVGGGDVPARMFGYGVRIGFSNAEEHQAFTEHPDRSEIEQTILQHMRNDGEETLLIERDRDQGGYYPNASPETFNDGTLGDFQVAIDDLLPELNKIYDLNIHGGYVLEESLDIPAIPGWCEEVPDNVASLPLKAPGLGG